MGALPGGGRCQGEANPSTDHLVATTRWLRSAAVTELDAFDTVRALADPVAAVGGRFMLHRTTMAAGVEAGYPNGLVYYVRGRGGVLGDVDADVVSAAFGFFRPDMVRALWEEGARVEPARRAARRYADHCASWGAARLAPLEGMDRLAELAERVLDAVEVPGLVLFAGWRAEPLPSDGAARAYQLLHVMREWRGSAHLVAVAASGLTPVEAILAGPGSEEQAALFGWEPPFPDVTDLAGVRRSAEDLTDELQIAAYESALDPGERAELVALVERVQAALARPTVSG